MVAERSPDRFTNASFESLLAWFFLTITGGIMNFSYICKVTHCLGLQLLFEKVNCNGLNQIGRPAQGFTQRIDDLTGFPSVE